MAETPLYTPEIETQVAQGLSFLPGASQSVSGLGDAARKTYLRRLLGSVDQNFGAQPDISADTDLSGPVRTTDGAKDIARKVAMDIKSNPDLLNDPLYIQQYQSLLGLSGLALDDDFTTVSDGERSQLDQLIDSLRSDFSLSDAFDRNAGQTRAAIEAAKLSAEQQAQLEAARDDAKAGLVYAGYLDADNVNDPAAYTLALKRLIADTTPEREWDATQSRVFANGKGGEFSADAATFIKDRLAGLAPNPDDLKADLESGDEARISNAQHYLSLMGADVDVNGVYDRKTADAALAELHKPLEMPSGILYGDKVDHRALIGLADHGDIALPEMTQDSLAKWMSPEDAEIAMTYPLAADRGGDLMQMSREAYVAERMIGDDPAKYESFLAEENARRAAVTIDAEVTKPIMETPVAAPMAEELDTANSLVPIENDGSEHVGQQLRSEGIAETSNRGLVAFETIDEGTQALADHLKSFHADGMLTMEDAFNAVYTANTTDMEYMLAGGSPGGSEMPPSMRAQLGQITAEQLGYESDHQFDLSNPVELQAVMTGLAAYYNKDGTGGGRNDFIEKFTEQKPEMVESIRRVAEGRAQTETPTITPDYDLQTPRMREFNKAVDGPALISGNDPAMSPDAEQVANIDRKPLAPAVGL